MRRYHLVKVHFDRRSPKATDEWLAKRFKFFEGWTLQSLLGQTFRDFRLWFHCDPGMEEAVRPLRAIAPEGSLFTFLPYGRTPLSQPDTAAMLSGDDRFRTADYVYVTRIDSDDLYACDAMALVDQLQPRTGAGIEAAFFKQGYIHDVRTGHTRTFRNASSPFHTLMIPREVFADAKRYAAGFVGDHSQVEKSYPSQGLPDWKFTVLVHGDNFLSDMNYSAANEPLEAYWLIRAAPCLTWQRQPVVFDLDDFCDRHNCLAELDRLKETYPDFRATLFTIPALTSTSLVKEAKKRDWLELAVHGIDHEPNEELKAVSPAALRQHLDKVKRIAPEYVRGFRPPGWFITEAHVRAISDAGFWVALHARDRDSLSPLCTHGFYCCEDGPRRRLPYWHGHCHAVCGNGIRETLDVLLRRWPRGQQFLFVSDAVLRHQGATP